MMKSYKITVNGNVYDVTVEETTGNGATSQSVNHTPVPQPAKAAPVQAKPQTPGNAGGIQIKASVPGKVIAVEASVGQSVKAGDNVVVLESMKMEIPVVAPQDGTIASIDVSQGNEVENGAVLATMN